MQKKMQKKITYLPTKNIETLHAKGLPHIISPSRQDQCIPVNGIPVTLLNLSLGHPTSPHFLYLLVLIKY